GSVVEHAISEQAASEQAASDRHSAHTPPGEADDGDRGNRREEERGEDRPGPIGPGPDGVDASARSALSGSRGGRSVACVPSDDEPDCPLDSSIASIKPHHYDAHARERLSALDPDEAAGAFLPFGDGGTGGGSPAPARRDAAQLRPSHGGREGGRRGGRRRCRAARVARRRDHRPQAPHGQPGGHDRRPVVEAPQLRRGAGGDGAVSQVGAERARARQERPPVPARHGPSPRDGAQRDPREPGGEDLRAEEGAGPGRGGPQRPPPRAREPEEHDVAHWELHGVDGRPDDDRRERPPPPGGHEREGGIFGGMRAPSIRHSHDPPARPRPPCEGSRPRRAKIVQPPPSAPVACRLLRPRAPTAQFLNVDSLLRVIELHPHYDLLIVAYPLPATGRLSMAGKLREVLVVRAVRAVSRNRLVVLYRLSSSVPRRRPSLGSYARNLAGAVHSRRASRPPIERGPAADLSCAGPDFDVVVGMGRKAASRDPLVELYRVALDRRTTRSPFDSRGTVAPPRRGAGTV
ncbi:hypothetical protein THAOC_08638, partial [Thalassiosira oceanica]